MQVILVKFRIYLTKNIPKPTAKATKMMGKITEIEITQLSTAKRPKVNCSGEQLKRFTASNEVEKVHCLFQTVTRNLGSVVSNVT